jgi:oligopeptide/dipeptide ABC transporter ATP-binding protein
MNRSELRAVRRRIQPVFQDPLAALSPRRTIMQTLREPLDHFSIGSRSQRSRMALDALTSVGLDADLSRRHPHELSGGQRQRVALARALVAGPELIVADEPVSALDLPMQTRIIDLVRDLRTRLGVAFLFVTHDFSVVRQVADSVAVLYGGRLVESGPVEHVLENPAHPYTRALLRAIPLADPTRPAPATLAGEPPSLLTPPAGCVFHNRCTDAMPECRENEPRLRAIAEKSTQQDTHKVRCHLWDR